MRDTAASVVRLRATPGRAQRRAALEEAVADAAAAIELLGDSAAATAGVFAGGVP